VEADTIFSTSSIARWGGSSIYVVDNEGAGYYLDGLPAIHYADWLPGSSVVRAFPIDPSCSTEPATEPAATCAHYLVAVGATEATLLRELTAMVFDGQRSYQRNGRAVFIVPNDTRTGINVGLLDQSGDVRIIAGLASISPKDARLSVDWNSAGTFGAFRVASASGQVVIIDPATGSVRPVATATATTPQVATPRPVATPTPEGRSANCRYSEVSSADGRYLATNECEPWEIKLLDRETGVRATLLQVEKGVPVGNVLCSQPGEWLDPQRLLITLYPGCGIGGCGHSFRILLAEASTLRVTDLTDGWELNARLARLTEHRLLVKSSHLARIFDYDGTTLFDRPAPPGTKYFGFAVSPDLSSFAYSEGPDWMRQWWCRY
jgi:hypothetical protein